MREVCTVSKKKKKKILVSHLALRLMCGHRVLSVWCGRFECK